MGMHWMITLLLEARSMLEKLTAKKSIISMLDCQMSNDHIDLIICRNQNLAEIFQTSSTAAKQLPALKIWNR